MGYRLHKRLTFFLLLCLLVPGIVFGATAKSSFAIDPSLEDLAIETGAGITSAVSSGSRQAPTAESLSAGEVRVGKSIEYNIDPTLGTPDGTITVTLSAWANTYTNEAGATSKPLAAMTGGNYLEIERCIGDFALLSTLPEGLILEGTTLRWQINDQYEILGQTPLEVSYVLSVVNLPLHPPFALDYWYSTAAANARFMPTNSNPFYWTMVETAHDEFLLSMSWNSGNGINSGAIIDNHLGVTIEFPSNRSPANTNAYNPDGSMNLAGQWNWWPQNANTRNQAARVTTASGIEYYSWHLHWQRSGTNYNLFTIKDFEGPGLDVQYEIYFAGPGGNEAIPGGRTITSRDYFQRSFNTGQADTFSWDGKVILVDLDVVGQIRLSDTDTSLPQFELTIAKEFGADDYHGQWGVDDDTEFIIHLRSETAGMYLVFTESSTGQYEYNGLAAVATPIVFSVNTPAVLTGLPTTDDDGQQKTYSMTEYFIWDETALRAPQVEVSYRIDAGSSTDAAIIIPSAGDSTLLTVTNTFSNPSYGVMQIIKLLDGFPADWGINSLTDFTFRVWDVDAEAYLLFVEPDEIALAPESGWSSFGWVEGTLFRVGSYDPSLEAGSGSWTFTDSYWEARDLAGMADILSEISIRNLQTVGLSNLWSGNYEIHELDFEGNLLETSPASEWWQVNYSFNGAANGQGSNQGTLSPSAVLNVTMTNFFEHAEGNLSLFKELSGHPEDWRVDESTEFSILVREMTTGHHLLFDPVRQADGTWLHVGYIDEQGDRTADDSGWAEGGGNLNVAIYALKISANSPIVLSGIDAGNNRRYLIEEVVDDGQIVRIFTNGEEVSAGAGAAGGIVVKPYDNIIVTIVNHYLQKEDGRMIIFKELAGDYIYFDITEDDEFVATITNLSTERQLLFSQNANIENSGVSPTSIMRSYTHVGEFDQDTGTVYLLARSAGEATWTYVPSGTLADNPGLCTDIVFSVNVPALLDDLVPGDFLVTEIPCPQESYHPTIANAGKIHLRDKAALGITIVNTWEGGPSPTAFHMVSPPLALVFGSAVVLMLMAQVKFRRFPEEF